MNKSFFLIRIFQLQLQLLLQLRQCCLQKARNYHLLTARRLRDLSIRLKVWAEVIFSIEFIMIINHDFIHFKAKRLKVWTEVFSSESALILLGTLAYVCNIVQNLRQIWIFFIFSSMQIINILQVRCLLLHCINECKKVNIKNELMFKIIFFIDESIPFLQFVKHLTKKKPLGSPL